MQTSFCPWLSFILNWRHIPKIWLTRNSHPSHQCHIFPELDSMFSLWVNQYLKPQQILNIIRGVCEWLWKENEESIQIQNYVHIRKRGMIKAGLWPWWISNFYSAGTLQGKLIIRFACSFINLPRCMLRLRAKPCPFQRNFRRVVPNLQEMYLGTQQLAILNIWFIWGLMRTWKIFYLLLDSVYLNLVCFK